MPFPHGDVIVNMWSDQAQHFTFSLFWTYMEVFCANQPRFSFFHNMHEKGEGKCFLDRYFGQLTALERTFLYNVDDIRGDIYFYLTFDLQFH